jgi:hypothetical protein
MSLPKPAPNQGLELTASSLRCAPASSSGSGLALDVELRGMKVQTNANRTSNGSIPFLFLCE